MIHLKNEAQAYIIRKQQELCNIVGTRTKYVLVIMIHNKHNKSRVDRIYVIHWEQDYLLKYEQKMSSETNKLPLR